MSGNGTTERRRRAAGRRRPRSRRGAIAALALALVMGLRPPATATGQTLEDLRFMSGCWEGAFGSAGGEGTIEEHYTTPSANVMLGTTRYLIDGRTVMFELHRILADSAGVVLTPYPRGRPSEHGFGLARADGRSALFEAPEHDFPKRILYRLEADGTLVARADGGEGAEGEEWRMRPAGCR